MFYIDYGIYRLQHLGPILGAHGSNLRWAQDSAQYASFSMRHDTRDKLTIQQDPGP